jgi:anthranilate synthase/aminodeoxychorismate synthase-like glutamine amidotransferase
MPEPLRILLVDNFDSFAWNLVEEFARRGARVTVWRNTAAAEELLEREPSLVVLSPGPGAPAQAGCCIRLAELSAARGIPLLGVCLGHQAIVEAHGGTVGPADAIVHGKASAIRHEGGPAFDGVPSPFTAGRYHSLAASRLPRCLVATAAADGIVMAVSHRDAPQIGLQFHPESILTPDGGRIVENVLRWAAHARA